MAFDEVKGKEGNKFWYYRTGNTSVITQNGESQNGGNRKKMYAKFFEKQKTENWKLQICLSMRDLLVDIRH